MAEENWFDNQPALRAMFERTERAVAVFAELVLGDAQRNAPVEEGTLRGSGVVLPHEPLVPERDVPMMIEETVAFTVEYAAVQEVTDSYEHPMGGKAHYLEDSVKAHAPLLPQLVERAANL